jgi:signal transduction histidine kinase
MSVKATLHTSIVLLIMFSILIGVATFVGASRIRVSVERGRSADEIVKNVFYLNSLTDEYLARPSERILVQWHVTHAQIGQLLEKQVADKGEERKLLDSLKSKSKVIGLTFGSDTSGLPRLTARAAAQLEVNSKAMVVDANRLAALNFEEQEESRKMVVLSLIILALTSSISIVSIMVVLYRRVTTPLLALREGADKIARGDFDHRIHLALRDEFGELAHSYNEMAGRLSQLYRNLERKARSSEEVVEAQKEFIAVLSHELRNPLASLFSTLELMQMEREGDERLSETLAVMRRNIEAMRQLIDDLLEVSRVMREKITLKKELIDLRDVLREVAVGARRDAARKDQNIDLLLGNDPLTVDADPIRMTQVMTNLIDNAIKFTPEKGSIEIRARRDASKVVILVKDSGIGIRKEDMANIFEAFVQTIEGKREQEGRGLGLGLKVVKTLVELHDGSVFVESEGEGKGSEFTIELPLA